LQRCTNYFRGRSEKEGRQGKSKDLLKDDEIRKAYLGL